MKNLLNILKKEIFPISLILILAFARLIPHPPNFTPIIAVAIISGYFFKNFNLSVLILLTAMLISDLFIGFYENIIFVYLSLILIICLGTLNPSLIERLPSPAIGTRIFGFMLSNA